MGRGGGRGGRGGGRGGRWGRGRSGGGGGGRGHKRSAPGGRSGQSQPIKLTRKEREHLSDFGEQHPVKDFNFDDVVEASEDEDERIVNRSGEESGSQGEEEEEEEEEESAYNKLLGSLHITGKAAELLKKRKREQEGREEDDVDSEAGEGEGAEEEAEVIVGENGELLDDSDDEGQDSNEEEGEGQSESENEEAGEEDQEDEVEEDEEASRPKLMSKGKENVQARNQEKTKRKKGKASELSEDEEEEAGADSDDETDKRGGGDIFNTHFFTTPSEKIDVDQKDQWQPSGSNALGQHVALSHVAADDGPMTSLQDLKIKGRLQTQWKALTHQEEGKEEFTPLQVELLSHIARYRDVLYPLRTHATSEEIMQSYCLHALNHVYNNLHRTRTRVLKNSERIRQAHAEGKDIGEVQDQGFTRPKVLMLLPFRNTGQKAINTILALAGGGSAVVHNRKRFDEQFGAEEEEDDADRAHRPEDYNHIFDGNIDDCFTMGISFSRKEVKLYSSLYRSDIIVASPLGLRMLIGTNGDKKYDYDFLSSIEVVVMDQVDIFLMQNWEHLTHIFEHLNLQPKESHDTDISRLRPWYTDLLGRFYRQNIFISSLTSPEINSLFARHCHSHAGKARYSTTHEGSICRVVPQIQQVFLRLDCDRFADLEDRRFSHFIREILPGLKDSLHKHTAIFVSSYFNFVRLRNYFKKEEVSSTYICEYTKDKDISRARSYLYHGRRHFLLFTERFHFFRRYRLRGVHHVFFYELPVYPQFYSEIINFMESRPDMTCTALYSQYDALRLERIIGTTRSQRILESSKKAHMFC